MKGVVVVLVVDEVVDEVLLDEVLLDDVLLDDVLLDVEVVDDEDDVLVLVTVGNVLDVEDDVEDEEEDDDDVDVELVVEVVLELEVLVVVELLLELEVVDVVVVVDVLPGVDVVVVMVVLLVVVLVELELLVVELLVVVLLVVLLLEDEVDELVLEELLEVVVLVDELVVVDVSFISPGRQGTQSPHLKGQPESPVCRSSMKLTLATFAAGSCPASACSRAAGLQAARVAVSSAKPNARRGHTRCRWLGRSGWSSPSVPSSMKNRFGLRSWLAGYLCA